MRHHYSCPLRWSDMDAFGHVNNAVFIRYLEEARIDFMWRLAPAGGEPSFADGSVVARHEIDYLRPLVHRHAPVVVESWVTKINAASTTVEYEVRDEEAVYARARTVVVPYDFEEGRPRRITPQERAFLERYREDGKDAGEAGRQAAPDAQPQEGAVGV